MGVASGRADLLSMGSMAALRPANLVCSLGDLDSDGVCMHADLAGLAGLAGLGGGTRKSEDV